MKTYKVSELTDLGRSLLTDFALLLSSDVKGNRGAIGNVIFGVANTIHDQHVLVPTPQDQSNLYLDSDNDYENSDIECDPSAAADYVAVNMVKISESNDGHPALMAMDSNGEFLALVSREGDMTEAPSDADLIDESETDARQQTEGE